MSVSEAVNVSDPTYLETHNLTLLFSTTFFHSPQKQPSTKWGQFLLELQYLQLLYTLQKSHLSLLILRNQVLSHLGFHLHLMNYQFFLPPNQVLFSIS